MPEQGCRRHSLRTHSIGYPIWTQFAILRTSVCIQIRMEQLGLFLIEKHLQRDRALSLEWHRVMKPSYSILSSSVRRTERQSCLSHVFCLFSERWRKQHPPPSCLVGCDWSAAVAVSASDGRGSIKGAVLPCEVHSGRGKFQGGYRVVAPRPPPPPLYLPTTGVHNNTEPSGHTSLKPPPTSTHKCA